MLIGGDDISNDILTLGTCFEMFVYIKLMSINFMLISALGWLAEIWQFSRRGAKGELEVEFKFQRRSCKLSFLFPPCHQSALETLLFFTRSNIVLVAAAESNSRQKWCSCCSAVFHGGNSDRRRSYSSRSVFMVLFLGFGWEGTSFVGH